MMAEVDSHKASKSIANVAKKGANKKAVVLKPSTAIKTQKLFVDPATRELERRLAN